MIDPVVTILMTTYLRTGCAIKTIQGLKQNLLWPQINWWISDDGSPREHTQAIVNEIGPSYNIQLFNSERRGVGFGMNYCLRKIYEKTSLVFLTEDDWFLDKPLDLRPYVNLLTNHPEYGLVRFGYMCADLLLYVISEENKLLYRVEPNLQTYRYVGHPKLVASRFFEYYGWFDEGIPPGLTELAMCGRVNSKQPGPHIVIPADYSCYGAFSHLGSTSLADTPVG